MSKKKIKLKFYFFIMACNLFLGCDESIILEYAHIANWNQKQYTENCSEYLEISGLCFSSSYAVKKIFTKQENDILEVYLKISKVNHTFGKNECF